MATETNATMWQASPEPMNRRTFLRRAAALGCSASAVAAFLAACGSAAAPGGSTTTSTSTTSTKATSTSAASTAAATTANTKATSAATSTSASTSRAASSATTTSAAGSGSPVTAAPTATAIGGKHLTITAITLTYAVTPPPNDGPGLKLLNERFNIDFHPQLIPQGSYTEKLSAVIAGGDIPDIINFFDAQQMGLFYKWAGQGAFVAIDDNLLKGFQTFKYIADFVWNAVTVKGKRYAIPQYYPPYALSPSIRQDWLDNLGLKMPTTYDELKQVALAFTQQDPAKDGAKHYGIAMGAPINPNYAMGAYWNPGSWYHKDDKGNYLPGTITEAWKSVIQFHADLYKEGALTRDFAVMKNWPDVNKEFYSGKAGIFIGAPRGMSQDYMKGLLDIHPNAKPVPIYPFKAPDGSDGFAATSGYSGVSAISAKAAKDPDKVQRILTLLDFNRTFYPPDQQNPQNADYDWLMGHVGQGYDMKDGKAVSRDSSSNPQGLAPSSYMVGGTAWPPTDDAINYQDGYTKEPRMGEWAGALQKMWGETKPYHDPSVGVISQTAQAKGGDLSQFLSDEQTKMISGQRSIDTWDDMVKEYLSKGGQQIIDETNQGIKDRG
jgi:putative aldouronate transport system substrate-binding protein